MKAGFTPQTQLDESMKAAIEALDKWAPQIEKLSKSTGELDDQQRRAVRVVSDWVGQAQHAYGIAKGSDLAEEIPGIQRALGIPGLQEIPRLMAQTQLQEQEGQAGFGQGPLARFIPRGRGLYAGDMGALSYGLFNVQRLWRYTGGQVTQAMGQYAGYVGQQQQAMASLGIGEGYGGEAADIMGSQAAMQRAKLGFGRAAWETWGWVPRLLGNVDASGESSTAGRMASLMLPLAGGRLAMNLGANVASRMGAQGVAGGLGLAGTVLGKAMPAIGGMQLGMEAATWLRPDVYEDTGDAGAALIRHVSGTLNPMAWATAGMAQTAGNIGWEGGQRALAGVTGWFAEGGLLSGVARALEGSKGQEPAAGVEAFQAASMQLQQEYSISPQAADQALALYGQSTGRTVESGDWGAADIQAAARLARLAPGVAGQVVGGGVNLAIAAGIPMGDVRQAGMQEWYAGLGPEQRWGREQVAGMVQPFQMRMYQETGQFAPIDVQGMTVPQARQFQRLGAGDRFAWSKLGLQQGLDETVTIHPETGMAVGSNWGGGVLARGIQQERFTLGGLAQEAFEAANIQVNAEAATVVVGGQEAPLTQIGLRDLATRMQRTEQEYQWGQQLTGLGAQYAYTTGQMPGWAPEGTPQIGRGTWAIEDEQVSLAYQHQMAGFGFQREQLGLQDRQFYERWGQGQQRFGIQTSWQWEDMARNQERQRIQFGWGREDLAFRGAQSTLHYAWGQEDIDEQMRYATGRERRQLMKQQERTTIDYAMGMGRLETEEGRLGQREKWSEEDFGRERSRFQQRIQWSRQDMEMQRKHHEENMGLARRRLSENQKYYQDNFQLQEEQRQNSREYWEFTIQKQVDSIEHARELQGQLQQVQDLLDGLTQAQQEQTSWFAAQFEPNGAVSGAWQSFVGVMLSSINQMGQAATGYDQMIRGNPYARSHK